METCEFKIALYKNNTPDPIVVLKLIIEVYLELLNQFVAFPFAL